MKHIAKEFFIEFIKIIQIAGVCFVVLKVTGNIDWSWWYVTMPFYGLFVPVATIYIIDFITWYIKLKSNSKSSK